MKRADPNPRPVREWANEGSVSPVGSAEGKRPEFVSAKRVQTPLQGVCTTIERTDESRRAHFPGAFEIKGLRVFFCPKTECSEVSKSAQNDFKLLQTVVKW